MKKSTFMKNLAVISLSMVISASAQDKKNPDYSTIPRQEVPSEFKWRVEDIYPDYEAWSKDKAELAGLIAQIDSKGQGWTGSGKKMYEMYELSNRISRKASRLYQYAIRQSDVEMTDSKLRVMKGEMQAMFVDISSKTAFMNDDLLKLDQAAVDRFLQEEPRLKDYRFTMEQILREKPHILTSDQQKIMSLTSLYSGNISEAADILTTVDIPSPEITLSDGKKITLNYINYTAHRTDKNKDDRSLVMRTFWQNMKKYENTLATLLDGGMKQDLFQAKARNYDDCLQARLFGEDIDTSVYFNLISAVKNNLTPLHRYMKLKQTLLGLDKLKYEDVYASSVSSISKTYTFDEARGIITETLKPMGEEYSANLRKAFEGRWIDRYPNKNKQTGAYSSGIYDVHPFILMNFNGTYQDVSTLIHELGHSMHSYLSAKYQPYPDYQYTTFAAEIASTFNENMLMDYILKNEKDELFKLYILDNYLERLRATIYRQTMFADLELSMHRSVEQGKTLTSEWLNKEYLKLVRDYYGHDKGVVQVDDYIECEWGIIPHFYRNYYVFQYSTGIIASMALSQRVQNGETGALEKYLGFLKSGGSQYPIDALKKAGLDMTKMEPYNAAFSRFGALVDEMEKIVSHLKKDGKI